MKAWLLILMSVLLVAPLAQAGTIVGVVRAEGAAGAPDPNCVPGNYDSHAFRLAQRVDYSAMHDFVVYIEGPMSSAAAITNQTVQVLTRKISQHKAMFVPHVLPIVKGTTVEWPNNDDIFHNVFSYSEIQPFDLGLYKAPEVKKVTFDTAGRVDVFCSIHASMNCIVLVLDNPCFAATNERGEYKISNVPAGTYQLKAWHERLPSQRREIIVPADGTVKMDFTLGIKGLPKI